MNLQKSIHRKFLGDLSGENVESFIEMIENGTLTVDEATEMITDGSTASVTPSKGSYVVFSLNKKVLTCHGVPFTCAMLSKSIESSKLKNGNYKAVFMGKRAAKKSNLDLTPFFDAVEGYSKEQLDELSNSAYHTEEEKKEIIAAAQGFSKFFPKPSNLESGSFVKAKFLRNEVIEEIKDKRTKEPVAFNFFETENGTEFKTPEWYALKEVEQGEVYLITFNGVKSLGEKGDTDGETYNDFSVIKSSFNGQEDTLKVVVIESKEKQTETIDLLEMLKVEKSSRISLPNVEKAVIKAVNELSIEEQLQNQYGKADLEKSEQLEDTPPPSLDDISSEIADADTHSFQPKE